MSVCFPRGSTIVLSTLRPRGEVLRNDATNVVVKAAGVVHSVSCQTTIFDDFALFPSPDLVELVARNHGLPDGAADRFLRFTGPLSRTPWLTELVEQFFQRRIILREPADRLVHFEHEIIRELMLIREFAVSSTEADTGELGRDDGTLRQALVILEAKLFERIDFNELATACGCSLSTLMRLFKRVLNLAPATYQRQRRLEEADRLLRSDQGRSIEDVANLVGYESVSAFCRSYRRLFGKSPGGKD